MSATLRALTAPHTVVRQAVVVSVAGSVATVSAGSEFDATVPTQPAFTLATGDTVFLVSVGSPETWLIFASL